MVSTLAGLGLGQLLLALDRTMVTLIEAPRGLDMPVSSVALVDADDIRLGLAVGPGSADLFFLLGVSDTEALCWLEQHADRPVAIFVKEPTPAAVARAAALGTAVVTVDPCARWEHLYRLVNHALEHHGDRGDPLRDSGTDLFGLAQSIADRTRGMVCIEDADSHMLAYSASDEADELRRLTILGRAGPPEHLEWIGQWGIFDALRSGPDVVRVAERPELGLRPRLAAGIHLPADPAHSPRFSGTIWLQQGSAPWADDAEEILRGGAVLAARIMSRLAATPSQHTARVHQLLGVAGGAVDDVAALARELGIPADGRAALVGFHRHGGPPPTDVLALSASAFRPDAQVAADGDRVYVLFPELRATEVLSSWAHGVVSTLARELGFQVRAVTAPLPGLAAAATVRAEVDRVLDSAERHPGAIGLVTSLEQARPTVLLDEIVSHIATQGRLVDPRVRRLRAEDPLMASTLQAYLDGFGDIAVVAARLHVHPNTVRYRIRRVEKLLRTSLDDPDERLVLILGLRATERSAAPPPTRIDANSHG
ncbi:helix-turn-helix domain-containing protein [Mycobacterium sp. SMC-8]|uniref:PucR family transcriptional regulator n=1 Tax=Mycobacterium sp. SMC-8 TaxID=2857060 RepID=UPI0021B36A6D|nr:PucR family transcriptional regulator [Mycobacterium sp. SMC-8]UXA12174.1 helix-turn-helix domain-containing protein [Mycobacterium sp. SMC-8]